MGNLSYLKTVLPAKHANIYCLEKCWYRLADRESLNPLKVNNDF